MGVTTIWLESAESINVVKIFPVKDVDVTLVNPASVVEVAPKLIDVVPIVTFEFNSLELEMFPPSIMLVTVPTSVV